MFEAPALALRYGTFCSGIEGVSVAWEPLGCFEPVFFSEIDPFASAVLAHRWPEISNLGDLTALDLTSWRGWLDVVWGSTPCQTFSFAGLRRGLADKRGQLTLAFVKRVEEIDPTYVVWENVKGVLSDKSNAFGCLLGALAGEDGPLVPPGGKWSHAGYVLGPKRAIAWRLFDAQHGGVPQRRERVFLVGSSRGGADPRDILFEQEGLRRDLAPRRGASSEVAATLAGGARKEGGYSSDDIPLVAAFGGNDTRGPIDVAAALNTGRGPTGRLDFESETFLVGVDLTNVRLTDIAGTVDAAMDRGNRGPGVIGFDGESYLVSSTPGVADTVTAKYGSNGGANGANGGDCAPLRNAVVHALSENKHGTTNLRDVTNALQGQGGKPGQGYQAVVCATGPITHALKGEGADASEDGTGRGNPIIAFSSKDHGADATLDMAPTLRAMGHADSHPNAGGQLAIAFSASDDGCDAGSATAPTLSARGSVASNQTGSGQVAVAFGAAMRGREDGAELEVGGEISNALRGASGGGSRALALIVAWADVIQARVRRLTPKECERLQGLPDDHTRIPWRGRPAALCPDGPRYKTIGNGLAIPDVRWLGMRLATEHARHLRTLEQAA